MKKRRRLNRTVATVGAGMSRFGMSRDKDYKVTEKLPNQLRKTGFPD